MAASNLGSAEHIKGGAVYSSADGYLIDADDFLRIETMKEINQNMIDSILEYLGEKNLKEVVHEGLSSTKTLVSAGQITLDSNEAVERSKKDERALWLLKETGLINLVKSDISPNRIKAEVETAIATMDTATSFVDSHKMYFSRFIACDIPSFYDIYRDLGTLTGNLREEKIQKYIEEFEYNLNQTSWNPILIDRERIRQTIDDAFLHDKRYDRYLNEPLPDGAAVFRDATPYAFSNPEMSIERFKTELSKWFSREVKNIDQLSDMRFSDFKTQIQK